MSDGKSNVQALHEEMSQLSLQELCFLIHKALDMNMSKDRVSVMMRYLELAIVQYRLEATK